MPRLFIRDGSATRTHRITGAVVTIGRAPTNDIQLQDARVAPEHCRIEQSGSIYRLKDLKTPLGTTVNGARVAEHDLQYEDRVEIAGALLIFEPDPSDSMAPSTSTQTPRPASDRRRPSTTRLPATEAPPAPPAESANSSSRKRRLPASPPRIVWPAPVGWKPAQAATGDSMPEIEAELRHLLDSADLQYGVGGLKAAADVVDACLSTRGAESRHADLLKLRDSLFRFQEITVALNSEHNLDRLLNTIMDTMIQLTSAERGFLILLEGEKLDFRVARNFDREVVQKPEFKISHSIAESVIESGNPIITADAQSDDRMESFGSVSDLKLRSVLCLPFKVKDRVLGCLYIDNRFETGLFTQTDMNLLTAFAGQAAVAIENARLIEENERRRRELKKSNEQIELLNRRLEDKVRDQSAELVEVKQVLKQSQFQLETKYQYQNIIARSPKMQEIFRLVDRVTDSGVSVLLEGESGTGKELIARAVHFNGPRRQAPFITQNCAAIPETLLESELFGYVKGSFTGAMEDRKGLFELASGGTLFLDEIEDMPPEMQKKLLRALQEGEIRRVGGKDNIPVDVRLLSATNKDLQELIRQGKFREDLYYRMNVIKITLPPLRERREDIPLLVDHFLQQTAKETKRVTPQEVDRDALRLLVAYAWPGNIRELENEIYRAATLSEGVITSRDLRDELRTAAGPDRAPVPAEGQLKELVRSAVEQVERDAILRALQKTRWVKTETARLLGISRPTLDAKIDQYGIRRDDGTTA